MNPFLFEMANIREFASWCHPNDAAGSHGTRQRRGAYGCGESAFDDAAANHRGARHEQGAHHRRWHRRHERCVGLGGDGFQSLHAWRTRRASAVTWRRWTKRSRHWTAVSALRDRKWLIADVTRTYNFRQL